MEDTNRTTAWGNVAGALWCPAAVPLSMLALQGGGLDA
jgi:hypothetical protein